MLGMESTGAMGGEVVLLVHGWRSVLVEVLHGRNPTGFQRNSGQ